MKQKPHRDREYKYFFLSDDEIKPDDSVEIFKENYYNARIRYFESYTKTISAFVLSVGIGIFLILVFFGIISLSDSYSYLMSVFSFYLAILILLLTLSVVWKQYRKLLKVIDTTYKKMESSNKNPIRK